MKKRKHTSKRRNHWNPKPLNLINSLLIMLLVILVAMPVIESIPTTKADASHTVQEDETNSAYLSSSLARLSLDENKASPSKASIQYQQATEEPSKTSAEDQQATEEPSKTLAEDQQVTKEHSKVLVKIQQVEGKKPFGTLANNQQVTEELSEMLVENQQVEEKPRQELLIGSPFEIPNIEPIVVTARCTAYCPGSCCNGIWAGVTASGAEMVLWHTVAATKNIPFGTIVYIPYFADQPNGGWFVVEDRFGEDPPGYAFDILMENDTVGNEFGKRQLEVYIYM